MIQLFHVASTAKRRKSILKSLNFPCVLVFLCNDDIEIPSALWHRKILLISNSSHSAVEKKKSHSYSKNCNTADFHSFFLFDRIPTSWKLFWTRLSYSWFGGLKKCAFVESWQSSFTCGTLEISKYG